MLQSIEYLLSQFQYGRMEYYLVADEKVSIKIFGNFSKRDEQEIGSEENVRSEEIRSEDVTSERLGREEIGREEDVRREDIRSEEKFYDIADEEKDESEEDTIQYIYSFLNFADYF
jgi:hypothetical protein